MNIQILWKEKNITDKVEDIRESKNINAILLRCKKCS